MADLVFEWKQVAGLEDGLFFDGAEYFNAYQLVLDSSPEKGWRVAYKSLITAGKSYQPYFNAFKDGFSELYQEFRLISGTVDFSLSGYHPSGDELVYETYTGLLDVSTSEISLSTKTSSFNLSALKLGMRGTIDGLYVSKDSPYLEKLSPEVELSPYVLTLWGDTSTTLYLEKDPQRGILIDCEAELIQRLAEPIFEP